MDSLRPSVRLAPIHLTIEGVSEGAHSLAELNRELECELKRQGVDVIAAPPGGDRQTGSLPDFVLRHHWPPDFRDAGAVGLIMLLHWEYGSVPRRWVEGLEAADELWVLSTAVRDMFVRGGVPARKIAIIPGGVDPERFHPGAPPIALPTTKRFRFLFVGPPLRRKGIDVLLAAYRAEFRPDDDVCLVIKDCRHYGNSGRERVRNAAADPEGPEILFFEDDLAAGEMPGLYTACHAYVHPYRGEGFGLPIVEAMASGLPVAATGYGACLDYLDGDSGYLIDADEVQFPSARVEHLETVGVPSWAEPRLASVRDALRRMFEERDESARRAARGTSRIRSRFTWAEAARRAAMRLRVLRRRRRVRALAHFVEGSEALAAGRAEDACRSLAASLRHEPRFAYGLSELGVALASAGRPREAREALTAALAIDPELEEAVSSLAAVDALLDGSAVLGSPESP
jgi:glycosyltransferase involved in cell wall biosynthesis